VRRPPAADLKRIKSMRQKKSVPNQAHHALGWLGVLFFWLAFAPRLLAHDPGLSVTIARLGTDSLNIHLAMSPTDVAIIVPLDANQDGKISAEELSAAKPQLIKMAHGAFMVKQEGEVLTAGQASVQTDKTGALQFDIFYAGFTGGRLDFRSTLIGKLAFGHRDFFSLRDRENRLLGEEMLDANHDGYAIALAKEAMSASIRHSFGEFLTLGIVHIATGYDHMLFLLGLLMVGGSFKSALKIITAFTIAHSITLALATMNLVNIPPTMIEPLIAVSIIYVGVENILRQKMDKRWMLAFGFGLVHGCGFASALRDLGIGSDGTGIVVPLVSFNLGVEIAQLTLAAILLPIIWKLRERPQFVQRFVPAGSCLIALAGTWWLLQRIYF
jgi:hydrogenase/urease accessory protein HupE